jgi:hypothetical protein
MGRRAVWQMLNLYTHLQEKLKSHKLVMLISELFICCELDTFLYAVH